MPQLLGAPAAGGSWEVLSPACSSVLWAGFWGKCLLARHHSQLKKTQSEGQIVFPRSLRARAGPPLLSPSPKNLFVAGILSDGVGALERVAVLVGGHNRASVPCSQGSQWAENVALVLPPPWAPDDSLQKHRSPSSEALYY